MKWQNTILILVILSLVAVPLSYALATTTSIRFTIPTNVAFTLTLPGQAAVNATVVASATEAVDVNSTDGESKYVNPCVTGGTCQTSGAAIFQYDNTGTVNITIRVEPNTNLTSCLTFYCATTYAGLNVTPYDLSRDNPKNTTVVSAYPPYNPAQNWFMQANFTNCLASDSRVTTMLSYGY